MRQQLLQNPSKAAKMPLVNTMCMLVILTSVLAPALAKKPQPKSLIVRNAEPASESVLERGLVTETPTYRSILAEHGRHWSNTSHRNFHGNVLAYVTPWYSSQAPRPSSITAAFTC
eukprot:jgi/Mesen1/3520/ME000197S02536